MLGIGAIDAPMTTAYIADVISNYQISTKLGGSHPDRGPHLPGQAVVYRGRLGAMPKTIPVTISVDDQAFKRDRVYHIKVINHPLLASRLIAMVTDEAMFEMHPTPGDATAQVSYEVTPTRWARSLAPTCSSTRRRWTCRRPWTSRRCCSFSAPTGSIRSTCSRSTCKVQIVGQAQHRHHRPDIRQEERVRAGRDR